ncbi:MAG: hypothetical protein DRO13_04860 [Thermoprotei archaeon]|nr:MAG: hypothetical protein DRO13_04860 [Thermoprotei archaeon]
MPYRTHDKRVRNYDLAVIPDVVRSKFEARKSAMVDDQKQYQSLLTDMEIKVRGILDSHGIFGNFRIPYLNFARALFRAKGRNSGLALRKYATCEKAKFVEAGLDPVILDEIIQAVIGAVAY